MEGPLERDLVPVIQDTLIRERPGIPASFHPDGRLALGEQLLFQGIQFPSAEDRKPGLLRVAAFPDAREDRQALAVRGEIIGIVDEGIRHALQGKTLGLLIVKGMLSVPFCYRLAH